MKEFLYWLVYRLADVHTWILQLNNDFEYNLSDKQLHFLVIGVVGMVLFFLVHPIIRFLARRGDEIVISWFYTLTLIVVLTFGIEIGQKVTNTGVMDFADIVFGIVGFLVMFLAYATLVLLYRGIRALIRKIKKRNRAS